MVLRAAEMEIVEGGLTGPLVMIDLDRFKPVNDCHGHVAGDIVLAEVGVRQRRLVGRGGIIARFGRMSLR